MIVLQIWDRCTAGQMYYSWAHVHRLQLGSAPGALLSGLSPSVDLSFRMTWIEVQTISPLDQQRVEESTTKWLLFQVILLLACFMTAIRGLENMITLLCVFTVFYGNILKGWTHLFCAPFHILYPRPLTLYGENTWYLLTHSWVCVHPMMIRTLVIISCCLGPTSRTSQRHPATLNTGVLLMFGAAHGCRSSPEGILTNSLLPI